MCFLDQPRPPLCFPAWPVCGGPRASTRVHQVHAPETPRQRMHRAYKIMVQQDIAFLERPPTLPSLVCLVQIAPHHDGTALRAAIPAAAAAVVENAPVPTAASSSAPKPSTPTAPSAASPQAAPALHLAGTFSSPAGGASSAVSPGSASAARGGPTGSAAAGVDGSSPGAVAAPKGKGRARDSHAPTLPSSQAAAGVDTAPPPVSTTATKRKRQEHQQPARAPTATGELGGSCSGGIQNVSAP